MRFSVKLMASVVNARFCLSVMRWKTNVVGLENSDLATCCGGTFFGVAGIILVTSGGILSFWISRSS